MKTHHILCWVGAGLVAGYVIFYHHTAGSGPSIRNAFFNKKGYSALSRMAPQYYNATSMEGNAWYTESYQPFPDTATSPNWSLPPNGGDNSTVNAGWTSFSDTYAARVSNAWQQGMVAGSHN